MVVRARKFLRRWAQTLQVTMRKISGSQRWLDQIVEAGSSLEAFCMEHEKATSLWLSSLTQRVNRLEYENFALKERVRVLSGQGGEVGEPAARQ